MIVCISATGGNIGYAAAISAPKRTVRDASGDPRAGNLIRVLDGRYAAVLLANHGPVVSANDLHSAVYAAEELEETAKLLITLRGLPARMLEPDKVDELHRIFGSS